MIVGGVAGMFTGDSERRVVVASFELLDGEVKR